MTKKEREEVVFRAFRDSYGVGGQFVHTQGDARGDENGKPDFIGGYEGRVLGIEVTEIHDPEKVRGRTLREHEAAKDSIVERACKKAEKLGLSPLHVDVYFTSDTLSAKIDDLAEMLFEIVKSNSPGPGHEKDLDTDSGIDLPDDFYAIYISNIAGSQQHVWRCDEGGDVPGDFSNQLQETIRIKSSKIANYLKCCERCWLIVYSFGDRASNYYEFNKEVMKKEYESLFEKVFFMEVHRNIIEELHIRNGPPCAL